MGTHASVSELLARASERTSISPPDGKSSSTFERVVIDGERFFLKRLSPATDWIMRVTGDRVHRPYLVWDAGIMDHLPSSIDHTVVAMEITGAGGDAVLAMLMHDVAPWLVPEGDSAVTVEQHGAFVDHLAELCAHFWGFRNTVGDLTSMTQRLRFFDLDNVGREMQVPEPPGPISAAEEGWRRLPERSLLLAETAFALHDDPSLVTDALEETPATFLHGDWKMGNLGTHGDGRTILLDWAYPGEGPACWDLCWYLALNQARLPEPKDAAIARFRQALERHGVDTAGWFGPQLDLCVIGIMATFGWEKALGAEEELQWWERRVAAALERHPLGTARV